jgi:hypothetical protein
MPTGVSLACKPEATFAEWHDGTVADAVVQISAKHDADFLSTEAI